MFVFVSAKLLHRTTNSHESLALINWLKMQICQQLALCYVKQIFFFCNFVVYYVFAYNPNAEVQKENTSDRDQFR